jgi:hypothetical protein
MIIIIFEDDTKNLELGRHSLPGVWMAGCRRRGVAPRWLVLAWPIVLGCSKQVSTRQEGSPKEPGLPGRQRQAGRLGLNTTKLSSLDSLFIFYFSKLWT